MNKLVFLMLSFFLIGTSIKAETSSKENYETMNATSVAATEWTFAGTLLVETDESTLFNTSATVTATPNSNSIDLSIKGITILGIPINLTLSNLPYDGTKIPQGTITSAMGYTATFDEDCNIKEGTCNGIFLTISGTPSGDIYVSFQ